MIKCVASESTLMFQPVGLIHNGLVITANTACFPTRRLRRRCAGHRVQERASPRTTTAMPGRTPARPCAWWWTLRTVDTNGYSVIQRGETCSPIAENRKSGATFRKITGSGQIGQRGYRPIGHG